MRAHDAAPGLVFEDANVRVTAIENTHYHFGPDASANGRYRSYSYKFSTPHKTVVFTGDTGPSDALEALAADADMLVSEVSAAEDIVRLYKANGTWQKKTEEEQREWMRHQLEEHLSPEALGRLAARARVKKVILTHLTPVPNEKQDYAELVRRVKAVYPGEVLLSADLMRFD